MTYLVVVVTVGPIGFFGYSHHAEIYQKKPYPTPEAVKNVFALGVKENPAVKDFNPMVMWDLHHLRLIDDSGYIDKLYQ